jgi:pilus assembly protein CpaC
MLAATAALNIAVWSGGVVSAQDATSTALAQGTATTAPAAVAGTESQPQVVQLYIGQTRVLEAPWPAKRVSVADPAVADIDVTSPRRVLVQGKGTGVTDVVMWSEQDESWHVRVEVQADLSRLQGQLNSVFPGGQITVSSVGNVLIIRGTLARAEQTDALRQYIKAANLNAVDMTRVAGVQQVQLQVRVAEVSRTALRTLGINVLYGGNDFFGGVQIGSSGGPLTAMSMGVPANARAGNMDFQSISGTDVPPSATLFGGFPSADLEMFVQALAENQYLRILAEPNLVAYSGQEADFLAGGEIPIPSAQISGGTTTISVDYREFGIRLKFRPTVLGDGTIRLAMTPEVSELSDVGAISILGTRVPSLVTRRVQTTLELKSGQTFAIAGLINRSINARNSHVPGLGNIPVLGALFRSVRYESSDTELVVLVTATLAEPSSDTAPLPLPGDLHRTPDNWELYLDGHIESQRPAQLSAAQSEQLRRMGLDQLRGPGAWASYETQAPPSPKQDNGASAAAPASDGASTSSGWSDPSGGASGSADVRPVRGAR